MPRMQNRMGLPPGLGVPASLQQKIRRANVQTAPFQQVASNQYGPSFKPVQKGSLIYFNYLFWQHDPYPLVIVTDPSWGNGMYLRGVNLHYLTFPYIKRILQPGATPNCDNRAFSFYNISGAQYIVNAFRTYKRSGIRAVKVLDCAFILSVMSQVRTLDPQEVENMRQAIQQQVRDRMRARAQPKADQMSGRYWGMMEGQPQTGFTNVIPGPTTAAEQANIR